MIRTRWSSRLSFILAATGAAVGLGNIWKFPYMAGDNGGSAFVLLYLLCVALIGIPALVGEILIGRLGRTNVVDALKQLASQTHHSKKWQHLGWLGAITLLLVLSFYSVISGWSIAYTAKALLGQLHALSPHHIESVWQNFLKNPLTLLLWHTLFMVLTVGIVAKGVKAGIEKASNIMMPGLFLILLCLVFYGAIEGNFKGASAFLFKLDFTKIDGHVLLDALGHAFFTLAIGAGCMFAYGCYLPQNTSIVSSAIIISLLNLFVALLAGLAIFSLVFAHNLAPTAGPGLMFKTLPIAFATMPLGKWIGALFFVLLCFAALTSSISLVEPLVVICTEKWKFSRVKSAFLIGLIGWILGIPALMSFNHWENVRFLCRFTVFDLMTDVTTNLFLPLGALGFSIFAGWILDQHKIKTALNTHSFLFRVWQVLIRYVAPLGISITLLFGIFY